MRDFIGTLSLVAYAISSLVGLPIMFWIANTVVISERYGDNINSLVWLMPTLYIILMVIVFWQVLIPAVKRRLERW